MLDRSQDAKQRNYSREDESARRLWLTQRLKANPWEGRAPRDDEEDGEPDGRRRRRAPEEYVPSHPALIEQEDELNLEGQADQLPPDPFGHLLDSLSLGKKPHPESKY
ncbi:MAG: hypothetical protein VKN33_05970 [Candidatus Sericytochromatia bacterium]|nr:hypothetical protein [Candidatus Sericytochromatia bacterium]